MTRHKNCIVWKVLRLVHSRCFYGQFKEFFLELPYKIAPSFEPIQITKAKSQYSKLTRTEKQSGLRRFNMDSMEFKTNIVLPNENQII